MDAILLVAAERGLSARSWPPGETVPRPPGRDGGQVVRRQGTGAGGRVSAPGPRHWSPCGVEAGKACPPGSGWLASGACYMAIGDMCQGLGFQLFAVRERRREPRVAHIAATSTRPPRHSLLTGRADVRTMWQGQVLDRRSPVLPLWQNGYTDENR